MFLRVNCKNLALSLLTRACVFLRVLAAQELIAPLLARALFLIGLNAKIRLNAKLAVLSDLVSGYGENFFSAGVFFLLGLTF